MMLGVISTQYIPNKIKNYPIIQRNFHYKKTFRKILIVVISTTIINILSLSLIYITQEDPFILFLIVLFSIFSLSISIKIFKLKYYMSIIISILTLVGIGLIYLKLWDDNNLLFINIIITLFVTAASIMEFKKEKNYEPSKLKISITIFITITVIYLFLNSINSSSWKSIVTENTTGINYSTFNLLFNKGLVVKNKSPFDIEINKNFFENDDNKKLILKDKTKLNIDGKYWYLMLTNNLKLYTRNIDKKIVFLLIEEKVNSNADSIYNVIDISIIEKEN